MAGFNGADNINVADGNGSDFFGCGGSPSDGDEATDTAPKDAGVGLSNSRQGYTILPP